jgi:hypothetical protein
MAIYTRPTSNSSVFNSTNYEINSSVLTISELDERYLKLSGGVMYGQIDANDGLQASSISIGTITNVETFLVDINNSLSNIIIPSDYVTTDSSQTITANKTFNGIVNIGAISDVSTNLVNLNSTIGDLTYQLAYDMGTIGSLTGSISSINTSLGQITGTLSNVYSSLSGNLSSISSLNSSVGLINGSLTTVFGNCSNNLSSITAINTTLSNDASSITSINGSLTSLNTSCSNNLSSITSINTTLSNDASSITSINGSLTSLNTSCSNNASSITSINTTLSNDASSITSINGSLTTIFGNYDNITTNQTITGIKTYSQAIKITPTTNQLIIGTTDVVTLDVVQPSASRTYSMYDPTSNSAFLSNTTASSIYGLRIETCLINTSGFSFVASTAYRIYFDRNSSTTITSNSGSALSGLTVTYVYGSACPSTVSPLAVLCGTCGTWGGVMYNCLIERLGIDSSEPFCYFETGATVGTYFSFTYVW